MRTRYDVLIALALITARATSPGVANAQDQNDLRERCMEWWQMRDDRPALQLELERLLEEDPENICVGFVAGLLGGTPVAQVPQVPYIG